MPKIPGSFTVSARASSFYLLCVSATNKDIFVTFTGLKFFEKWLIAKRFKKKIFSINYMQNFCQPLRAVLPLNHCPSTPKTFPASSITVFPGDYSFLPLEYNLALTFFDYRVLGPNSSDRP